MLSNTTHILAEQYRAAQAVCSDPGHLKCDVCKPAWCLQWIDIVRHTSIVTFMLEAEPNDDFSMFSVSVFKLGGLWCECLGCIQSQVEVSHCYESNLALNCYRVSCRGSTTKLLLSACFDRKWGRGRTEPFASNGSAWNPHYSSSFSLNWTYEFNCFAYLHIVHV